MRLRDIDVHERDVQQPSSIDAWLEVLDRLLRLPGVQRDSIREELRGHLTERTRDLMLRGLDGESAMRQAIEELGEAAELAERFRHANRYPKRRLIMNTLLVGAGTIAVVASVAVMTNGSQFGSAHSSDPAMYAAADQEQRQADASTLDTIDIDVEMDMSPREIVQAIVDTNEIGVSVDWRSLGDAGLDPDQPLGFSAQEISVLTVLDELNRRFDDAWDTIDWRLKGRMLILDRRDVFDRQESRLVSFDISATLLNMFQTHGIDHGDATEQVSGLIYEMVEPEYWDVNGGATAHMQIVGGKLFVHAPMRMQEKVKWILDELSVQPEGAAMDDDPNVMPQPTALEKDIHMKRQQALAAMRKISIGWNMWAAEQDVPLTNLQQLVDVGYLQPGDLRSPLGPMRDGSDYWIDYSFNPNVDTTVDWAARIVGVDRAMYEQMSTFLVLFADSHLELIDKIRLMQLLDQPANNGVQPKLPKRRVSLDELKREIQHSHLQQDVNQLSIALQESNDQRDESLQLAQDLQYELQVAVKTRELVLRDYRALQEQLLSLQELLKSRGIDQEVPATETQ